jgi:hypothetical protein
METTAGSISIVCMSESLLTVEPGRDGDLTLEGVAGVRAELERAGVGRHTVQTRATT